MTAPAACNGDRMAASTQSVQLLSKPAEFPSARLGELRDSTAFFDDAEELRRRLDEDGYVLIRGLIPRETVMASRRMLIESMLPHGGFLPGSDPMEGLVEPGSPIMPKLGRAGLTRHPLFLAVVEHPRVMDLFARLLGGPVITFHHKWLRATVPGRESYTGAHMDVVYMGRGTERLRTCWIAHGDIPVRLGPIAILPGSHRHPAFARIRETYGRMDVDRDQANGWFTHDPDELSALSGQGWATTDFRAGDAVFFGMHLLHGSLANGSDRIRLSSDTRYQRADEPIDPRWSGPDSSGHDNPGGYGPIEPLRRAWGV